MGKVAKIRPVPRPPQLPSSKAKMAQAEEVGDEGSVDIRQLKVTPQVW